MIERSIFILSVVSGSGLLLAPAVAQPADIASRSLARAVRPAIVRLVGTCQGSYRLPDTGKSLSGSVPIGVLGTGAMVSTDGYVLTSDRLVGSSTGNGADTREQALARQKDTPCESQLRDAVATEFTQAIALVGSGGSSKLADINYVRNQLQIQSLQLERAVLLEDGRELEFEVLAIPASPAAQPGGDLALLKLDLKNAPAVALVETMPPLGTAIARVGYPTTPPEAATPPNPAEPPAVTTAVMPAFSEGTAAIALPESAPFAGSPLFNASGQLVALQVDGADDASATSISATDIQQRLRAIDITLTPTPTLEGAIGGGLPPAATARQTGAWWKNPFWLGSGALLALLGAAFWFFFKRQSPSPLAAPAGGMAVPPQDPSLPFLPPNLLAELDEPVRDRPSAQMQPGTNRMGRDRAPIANGAAASPTMAADAAAETGDVTHFMPFPMAAGSIGFISGELAGQQFDIPPQGLSIGRDGTVAQLVIDSPGISRKHVWIGQRGDRIVLMDCDSVNGTFLNDLRTGRVQGEVDLQPGDTVILADNAVQFRYLAEDAVSDETVLALGPSVDYGSLTCTQCIDRRMVGRVFRIPPEGLTVGRDATQAHIAIDSHEISKQHVWIGPIGDYVYAVDSGSLNGTYLNQLGTTSIREEKLAPGDTIVVSNSNIAQFRYSPPQSLDADLESDEETWFPDL